MSGAAIIMMLVSTGTIWGGLVIAITNLLRQSTDDGGDWEPE